MGHSQRHLGSWGSRFRTAHPGIACAAVPFLGGCWCSRIVLRLPVLARAPLRARAADAWWRGYLPTCWPPGEWGRGRPLVLVSTQHSSKSRAAQIQKRGSDVGDQEGMMDGDFSPFGCPNQHTLCPILTHRPPQKTIITQLSLLEPVTHAPSVQKRNELKPLPLRGRPAVVDTPSCHLVSCAPGCKVCKTVGHGKRRQGTFSRPRTAFLAVC